MRRHTIYVQVAGGKFEARYWDYDEQRYFRRESYERIDAVKQLCKYLGMKLSECKIVDY